MKKNTDSISGKEFSQKKCRHAAQKNGVHGTMKNFTKKMSRGDEKERKSVDFFFGVCYN